FRLRRDDWYAKSAITIGGSYIVTGLPAGSYFARTAAPSAQNLVDELFDDIPCFECAVTSGTPIAVAAGSTHLGVDFALSPGARISGFVIDELTSAPLVGVTVRIYTSVGTLAREVMTARDGSYVVDRLP